MSDTVEIQHMATVVKHRPTLARRVSDMFKADGNMSGPPVLFRHGSMQRIRHCCQNLNLFPYLLYSFGNSKSHPVAKKIHLYFIMLLRNFLAIAKGVTASFLRRTFAKEYNVHYRGSTNTQYAPVNEIHQDLEETMPEGKVPLRFGKFERQKRKRISLVLTAAVYFALLVLASQMIGLFSLMIFGKYPPGFIFLISALLFLGCISLKIMVHDTLTRDIKEEKRKSE